MDMIVIDIGNSAISVGVFADDSLRESSQVPASDRAQLESLLKAYRAQCGEQPLGARTVPLVACFVDGTALERVEQAVVQALDQNVLVVGRDFPLEMKVAVENPESVGADRLLTAAAAYDVVEEAVVIVDFGTATTIDVVNDVGIFLGGVIMPGLAISAKCLHESTSALPEVPIALPTGDYGTNTVTAIQNGLYYAALGALREVVERYATQLGRWPQVVATGGYSKLIAEKCDIIDSLVPDLCLNGLYLAYQKFRCSQPEDSVE